MARVPEWLDASRGGCILSGMAIGGGLLLAGLPGLNAIGAGPPPEPSVQTLMAGYAQTRQAFRSYLLSFDKSMVQGYETAGEPPVRETFEQLEICTDGRRWKLLETSWGGEIGVNYLSKETAARYLPELNYWDGASHYHRKPLSSSAPADTNWLPAYDLHEPDRLRTHARGHQPVHP